MPLVKPIRGGTDGARLSFMGLPCLTSLPGTASMADMDVPTCKIVGKSMETIIKITIENRSKS